GWFTREPKHEIVELGDAPEVVGDIVLPAKGCPCPAVIFAMGVYTQEKDRPLLLGAADSFARLGYVAIWPRSKIVDKTEGLMEDPQVFVESFKYLGSRGEVNPKLISLFGFSVGSSIAMVAAENPDIADKVHSLIWFGGYYSLEDYLTELATRKIVVDGQEIPWEPAEGATSHAEKIMQPLGGSLELFKEAGRLTEEQKQALERLSPDVNLNSFKARLFILHDKNDSYVPWIESQKLKEAVGSKVPVVYHIADLFGHVQPKGGKVDWGVVKELWGMYRFVHKVFSAL
ncbi:MAG: hypothetical protein HY377_02505, partial [Candidatus Blackburnbacteria bacterium]|nr:hypothetical protein [Candidatus Blackburnbacteria bacterium]